METGKLAILQAGECTVQEIIKRAKDFKISSKNFKLSVNERRIKDTNVPRQCQMSYGQEQNMYWCDYYPDLNDCLESTLDGSRMMPFSHHWLLKNESSSKTLIKEGRVVHDFKELSDISLLNMPKEKKQTDSFQRLQKDTLLEKPTKGNFKTAENIENKEESVINSLEEYERVIEMAKSTAEKYNFVEETNAGTNDICNKKQTSYLTKLQMKKNESLMDTMAESFVNEILRKAQVEMMMKSINEQRHATTNDIHGKFQTSYLTKLQIKKEETCIDTMAEVIVNEILRNTQVEMMKETIINEQTHATTNDFIDKNQTSYLTKLQIKKEETYIDTMAETIVNEILRNTQAELVKESINEQTPATANDFNDQFQTSYLTKLQIKKEETYVDTTAETFVNEILKKTQEELIKESINEQMHSLETVNSTSVNENQNIDHQSIDIIEPKHIDDTPKPKFSFISSAYGSMCMEHTKSFQDINSIPVNVSDKVESQYTYMESKYFVDTSKPKFSLISSAYGSIWMEHTEVPKRKSWRQRVKSVFCMGRCRVTP